MPRKTLDQQIADTANKLSRLKTRARSARTHRLCQFGGVFDSVITDQLLADLALMTDAERSSLRDHVAAAIARAASPRRASGTS